jgi:hypothetical protein
MIVFYFFLLGEAAATPVYYLHAYFMFLHRVAVNLLEQHNVVRLEVAMVHTEAVSVGKGKHDLL